LSLHALSAFLLFAALAIVLPGVALQRLFRVRVEPAVVLPLGTAFCAGAYWLSLVLDRPWLFPTLVVLAIAPWIAPTPGRLGVARTPRTKRPLMAQPGSAGASEPVLRQADTERAKAATPARPARADAS